MRTSHAFCRIAQGRGERRIPRSGDALGEECRMPFIGPLKERERRIPRSGDTQGRSAKLMLRQR